MAVSEATEKQPCEQKATQQITASLAIVGNFYKLLFLALNLWKYTNEPGDLVLQFKHLIPDKCNQIGSKISIA